MTTTERIRASHAATNAIRDALDNLVADEATAMTALAVALGERIGSYATTEGGMLHGVATICAVVEGRAMDTFAKGQGR